MSPCTKALSEGLSQKTCSQEDGFGLWFFDFSASVRMSAVRAHALLPHEAYRSWGKKTPWLRSPFPQDPKPTNPAAFATLG